MLRPALTLLAELLIGAAALSACGDSSNTPDAKPADGHALDAPRDTGEASCADSTTCTDPSFPVCTADHVCRPCTATDQGACTNVQVCGSDDFCRACALDAECASGLCFPSGRCAVVGESLFATPGGSATAACTHAAPCSFAHAVALAQATDGSTIVLAAGTYTAAATVVLAQTTVIGGHGAVIALAAAATGPVISATGNLELDYVTVEGATDPSTGSGVAFSGGQLTLTEVTVRDNAALGVISDASSNSPPSHTTITRSVIENNGGGGLLLASMFDTPAIENNFILYNGHATGTTSTVGGAAIGTSRPGTFRNNTIAFNESDGVSNRGGYTCSSILIDSNANLEFHNSEPDGAGGKKTDLGTQGTSGVGCNYGASLGVATDANNLGFASPLVQPYDFHLTSASPSTVIDVPGADNSATTDFDGDARPQGSATDLGADEYKP